MNETPSQRRRATAHRTDGGRLPFGERDLVVVSNRQPYSHADSGDGLEVDRPTGGLTAGLDPVMQATGGTWIAWGDGDADRRVVDGTDRVSVPPDDPSYVLRRVWLSDDQVEDYYYGFSNRVLWPVCHGTLGTVNAGADHWAAYERTNRQFANIVASEASDRSTVWFHDYHLALAPAMARRTLGGGPTFMQFWHVPWPGWDTFRACPHREALLRGLLANDVLGVHVPRYRYNFFECVDACLDDATVDHDRAEVTYRGSVTRVVASPMGVPYDDIRRQAANVTESDLADFRREYDISSDTALAVGVDRLDYTKGIVERIRGLERFWERNPAWRESLTFVQNGSESRSRIDAYARTQEVVADAVERVNDRFGTDDWQPIVFFTDTLEEERLYGLYRHADVALVTPIRDGLNLVAMEYVAAQVDGDGALLLSDQSGAHDLLGEFAYSISPFDAPGIADQLAAALTAPAAERTARMKRLRQSVAGVDLRTWLQQHADLTARADTNGFRQSGHEQV